MRIKFLNKLDLETYIYYVFKLWLICPVYIKKEINSRNVFLLEQSHNYMCLRNQCGQRRPRPDCASAQSGLSLHCPLTDSFDIVEYIDIEQRSLSGCAASLAELDLYCSHMSRRNSFLGAVHIDILESFLQITEVKFSHHENIPILF